MNLRILYDKNVDVLRLLTGEKGETSSSLVDLPEVVVDLAQEEGHHVVGLEVLGAAAYLPLGKRGYNPGEDTLTLGETAGDPTLVTENGDIVTYWRELPNDPVMDPIGVTIRRASEHLNGMFSGTFG